MPVVQEKKFGRPTVRTPRNEAVILGRLVQGRSLIKICKSRHLPSYTTVVRWLESDENFRQKYATARKAQAETHVAKIVDIADKATPEMAQVARLRIDTRKWIASKLLPKVYGEKSDSVTVQNTNILQNVSMPAERLKELQAWRREALGQ